jgi:hypothetical protein
MTQLRLPCAEFSEDLGEAACFHPAAEEGVEVFGARGELDEVFAAFELLGGGQEAHGDEFVGDFFDFLGFLVGDALEGRREGGREGRESESIRSRRSNNQSRIINRPPLLFPFFPPSLSTNLDVSELAWTLACHPPSLPPSLLLP